MTKYISFSLWGNNRTYTIGALKNVELAKEIYSGWKTIIYHDDSVPIEILDTLKALEITLVNMSGTPIYGCFWRFLAADFPDCEYAIFRDTDSRLSKREYLAVQEWTQNNKNIHIMRDHPYHEIPFGSSSRTILAGMWGIKGGVFKMQSAIIDFCKDREDKYGIDQAFLELIYKKFNHSQTVHDEFFEKKPFPIKRKSYRFIGERIDENDLPIGNDWTAIKRYYKENPNSILAKLKQNIKKIFSKKHQ